MSYAKDPRDLDNQKISLFVWLSFGLVIGLFFIVTGCATFTATQNLDPKVYYRHDIRFKIDKKTTIKGVGILPIKKVYSIEAITPGKIDLIKITTCHRQLSTEDIPKGWFKSGRNYKYTYRPTDPIETKGSCMIRFEAYEAGKEGRHSSGLIEFQTPTETVPALIRCNGGIHLSKGVSICQSWQGLEQEIKFTKPVRMAYGPERCKIEPAKDSTVFRFRMRPRECTYTFLEKGTKDRWHRLQTIGYEEIPVRGK